MLEVVLFVTLAAMAWFWSDTLRARERALKAGARACAELNVQFLDQTVALTRLKMARNARGQVQWRRAYRFEFSTDGADRWFGHIDLLGTALESVRMDSPNGVIVLDRFHAG